MASRDLDIFAAEYVLGTLSASERARAEKLRSEDTEFSDSVDAWERRFAALADTAHPVAPPPTLWRGIEKALAARVPGESRWQEIQARIKALQQSLAAWRMAAIGAATAAAAITLAWFGGLEPPMQDLTPPVRYVAMLQSEQGQTGFVVTLDMKEKSRAVRAIAPDLPPAKAYELWALMESGKAPMSLGLVGTEAYAMVDMPVGINPQELEKGVRLAISLEPPTGAPSGQAMGPIVFAGDLIRQTP